jgi:hypothetical protein
MKICVMGNSHLACLKLGWQRASARHADVELTFFGTPGLGFQGMKLLGGRLVPASAEVAADMRWTSGSAEIALERFDVFVLVALQFAPTRVSQVARHFSYVDERLDPRKRLVSRACIEQAVLDGLQSSIAISLARAIGSSTSRPVILLPQPHVSAAWRATEAFQSGFRDAPAGCWPLLAALWRDCASRTARDAGADVLFQPRETVEDSFFTQHRYCRDSVMLAEGYSRRHPDDDFVHMNAEYGEILIETLLRVSSGRPAATAPEAALPLRG